MLLSHLQRLPWPLACLLFATVAAATITPSNTSTAGGRFQGTLPLKHADQDQAQLAELVPLTREAAQRTVRPLLVLLLMPPLVPQADTVCVR
jgi:hypothetical protein